jgi:pantoate kinase
MDMNAIAFVPGHISAFFEPVYCGQNLDRTGSRGAGINISLGVVSQVQIQPALQQTITISINGKPSTALVTKMALSFLVGSMPINIHVDTQLDLPVSQGFGMSAGGALSATLAAADLLHLSRHSAVKAAHYAEVQLRTGLSDVVASNFGGIEIRREPGLPPWGMIEHIPGSYDVVVCVIGKKMKTKEILSDVKKLSEITSYGRYCMKKLLEKPSIERLFSLALEFTKKSGLADERILEAIEAANRCGMASMCMLGNSVFAVGNVPMIQKILAVYGKVWVCHIDQNGAQMLGK